MSKIFTTRILGTKLSVSDADGLIAYICENLDSLIGHHICLTTMSDLISSRQDECLKSLLKYSAINFPLDEPIAWIQRLRGFKSAESLWNKDFKAILMHELEKADSQHLIKWVEADSTGSLSNIAKTAERDNKLIIYSGRKTSISTAIRFIMSCIPDSFKWQQKDPDEKKDLLIYAHYYYPDVASTGQILTELAEGLNDTFHTTVICTVPSYFGAVGKNYKQHQYYYENINGVDVLRIRVPEFRKSFSISRVVNILSYFFYAITATFKVGHQDYVFTISQPPVLGGLLGVVGKYAKRAKFIYNIQDFNPEQIMAVSFTKNKLITNAMMALDKFSCKKADKVIVVGRDMVDTLKNRFPANTPSYAHINNWINETEIYPLPSDNEKIVDFKKEYNLEGKFVIMYSGNIGLYYDLLEIQKVIEHFRDNTDVVFAFVGGGSTLEKMQVYAKDHKMDNLIFIPYQDKSNLVYSLNAGDVHFVVNAQGIKGVSVPSKLYGVMAAGKPVLGILDKGSEARMIVEESGCGKVVSPGDYEAIHEIIRYFIDNKDNLCLKEMGDNGRAFLEAKLTKDISIKKYADEILS